MAGFGIAGMRFFDNRRSIWADFTQRAKRMASTKARPAEGDGRSNPANRSI